MMAYAQPALYAVLVWWFTTGVILFLDGLAPRTFRLSFTAATLMLGLAIVCLWQTMADTSPGGAYAAFSCAILVWGWLEMSFLMGFITGPRRLACPPGCAGWQRFVHATQAIIYNELATLAGGVLVLAMTWGAANRVALYTYAVLWSMRLSAKLNLFLGVPNTGEKFLPEHLQYLTGYFRKRRMNLLFPVSITASTAVVVLLIRRCLLTSGGVVPTGMILVASLLALAVLEHWFMVLPLPSERLWGWGFHDGRAQPKGRREARQPA
jgi:putative photosynthetic complex assembly protein 2